jgi:transposase
MIGLPLVPQGEPAGTRIWIVACGRCDKIVQAEAPSRPIARGMAGPGLLAHVLVSKYADHLPLYRQEEIYERQGVELDRSTLADWVGQSSALLQPLVEALRPSA